LATTSVHDVFCAGIGDTELELLDDAERWCERVEVEAVDVDADAERELESELLEDEA
jgi:hypothetical protein